ncbi:MAG: ATP phosphoribosyltransferase [Acidobacteriota bacterium]|nr:ATP phosphoribosyltransferase [Acidobacteriota bacterium]
MGEKLKIAIQKSGRLSEDSVKMLRECAVRFQSNQGKLKAEAENFPLEIFFLRDDDIPEYVADAVADIGIVGENVLLEAGAKNLQTIEKLGFGKCRLSLAVPRSFHYDKPADLNGKRIATSYPRILNQFLKNKSIEADIHTISGSVEIAPGIGLAEAICDLVSSGSTLLTNGLREVETVLQSEAVLVSRENLPENLQEILNKLLFRLKAVKAAKNNRYILLNAPNAQLDKIISLLPGIKSPTVMPLATEGWSSIHSVIEENDFWEIVENLKAAGAEGILVLSIEQMIK